MKDRRCEKCLPISCEGRPRERADSLPSWDAQPISRSPVYPALPYLPACAIRFLSCQCCFSSPSGS